MVAGVDISSSALADTALADLARINIRYLLEWRQSGQLYKAISLPLPPRSISINQQAPSIITYTLGGVIREAAQYRRRSIRLNGSAGFDARIGYNRNAEITVQTGDVILREFRAFLEDYQSSSEGNAIDEEGRPLNQLIFRALDEDYHLQVEVSEFELQRDANGAHFASDWILNLDAYDNAEPERPFSDAQDQIDAIIAEIDQVNANIALVSVAIDGALGVTSLLLSPLDSLRATGAALESVRAGFSNVLDLPSDLVGAVAQNALRMRTSLVRAQSDLDRFPNKTSARFQALRTALFGAEAAERAAEALAVFAPPNTNEISAEDEGPLYLSRSPVRASQSQTPSRQAVEVYRLRLGEDLSTIAFRLFGDGDRWPEIASINGWIDPTRTASGRYVRAGDIILIPSDQSTLSTSPDDLYGEDLALIDGDLKITAEDFVTVSGVPNVEQGVLLRVRAVQNETPILAGYGLPSMIGRRLSASSAGYLAAHVREQISRDVRVLGVPIVEVVDLGDQLNIDVQFRTSQTGLLTMRVNL